MKSKNIYLFILIALMGMNSFACSGASSGESNELANEKTMVDIAPPSEGSPFQIRDFRPLIISPQANGLALDPVYGKFQAENYPGSTVHFATDWQVFDHVSGELLWQSLYNLHQLTAIHLDEGTFIQPLEEETDRFLKNGSYSLRVRFYENQGEEILKSQWSDPAIFQTGNPLPPIWALGRGDDPNLDSSRSQLPGGFLSQPPVFGFQGWEFAGGGMIFIDSYGALAARDGITLTLRLKIHEIQEGRATLLSRSSATACSYQITLDHGIPHFHLCADGQKENEVDLAAPDALTPDKEHTVTALFDGIDMILYVDRKPVAITDAFANQEIFDSETNLRVGIGEDGQSEPFYGNLIGASIFRRALSEINEP